MVISTFARKLTGLFLNLQTREKVVEPRQYYRENMTPMLQAQKDLPHKR